MTKLVLNLSPAAKVGFLLAMAGVGLGVYARMREVEWAGRASLVLVVAGALMYYTSRFRSFRKKRKW